MKTLGKIIRSRLLIIAVAVVLIYTLSGFLLIPFLVRHYTPKIVQEKIAKKAAIGEVRFNPYLFRFEANDLSIAEPDGSPIAGFQRLFCDFELKSLFKWAWTFREVSLKGLKIHAVIEKDGRLNLASLAPPAGPSPPKEKDGGQPPSLILEDIRIDDGRIDATDRRQSQPAKITIHPLSLHLKNFTTLPGQEGEQLFQATTTGGESFQWSGKVGLNPVAAKGHFSIENLKISTLTQFARDSLNLEPPAGKLTLKADYGVDLAGENTRVLLSNLSVALTGIGLKLQGAETPFLELSDALLSDGRLDLAGRSVEVGSVAVKGGRARLAVGEDGALNVQRIAKASGPGVPAAPQPAAQADAHPWKIVLSSLALDKFAVDYRDRSRTPGMDSAIEQMNVGLKATLEAGSQAKVQVSDLHVGLSGIQAGFPDSAEPVLRVEKVGLEGGAYNLSENRFTAAGVSVEGGRADVRRQPDGSINLASLFQPKEKGAAARGLAEAEKEGRPLDFLVDKVSLSGLQTIFSDLTVRKESSILTLEDISATVSNVDGKSPMKFDLRLQVREGGRIEAAGTADPAAPSVDAEVRVVELGLPPFQPYIGKVAEVMLRSGTFSTRGNLRHGIQSAKARTAFDGKFKCDNLQVTGKTGSETLVGWKLVASDQLKLRLGPDGVEIGDVTVSQLAGKIVIEKDRSFNLAQVIKSDAKLKPEDQQKKPAAGTGGSFPYRVHRILMSGGRVDFADLSLPIPFGTKVHELKGSIAGISSTRNARAQIKLDGRVDDYGTAKVGGELNTSNPKAFTDISVVFRNVEMSRLTPYSGKFAGRKIDSGKLSVDLKYKIQDSQLSGDNQIVVERLKLGEKFESPEAVNLPLDLAVALLEDSNGVIDLGLPVHGNLDSPEFSYGALIWKAIVNVLTKIVTSPFRALAALIPGGGEETLKSVAFEAGSADVPPPEKEKLAKLAGALQKRPQLRLTVQGRYNPELDRSALRTDSLSRTLWMKLGRGLRPGVDPGLVDFGNPKAGKALEAMFSERFGADALKAVKSELKAARKKAKKEAAEKEKAAGRDEDTEDPGELARILFRKLEEVEPVDDATLVRLANARANAVIGELSGPLAIPAERLDSIAPVATESSDPITAELNLEITR